MASGVVALNKEPIDTHRRTQLLAVAATLTGIGTFVVGLRMISRARVLHSTGKDDWMMLAAWVRLSQVYGCLGKFLT